MSAAQAHGGAQSVFVDGSSRRSGILATLPASGYFARAWMRVETPQPGVVLAGFGSGPDSEVRLGIWNNARAVIRSTAADELAPPAARLANCPSCIPIPARRWFCVEYRVDDEARTATLRIDQREAATFSGTWPNQGPSPEMFLGSLGLQGASDVYVDDVAVGPEPIGCE